MVFRDAKRARSLLFLHLLDDDHGAVDMVDNVIADASQEHSLDVALSAVSRYQAVKLLLHGGGGELHASIAVVDLGLDLQVLLAGCRLQLLAQSLVLCQPGMGLADAGVLEIRQANNWSSGLLPQIRQPVFLLKLLDDQQEYVVAFSYDIVQSPGQRILARYRVIQGNSNNSFRSHYVFRGTPLCLSFFFSFFRSINLKAGGWEYALPNRIRLKNLSSGCCSSDFRRRLYDHHSSPPSPRGSISRSTAGPFAGIQKAAQEKNVNIRSIDKSVARMTQALSICCYRLRFIGWPLRLRAAGIFRRPLPCPAVDATEPSCQCSFRIHSQLFIIFPDSPLRVSHWWT
ncbi:hypothetical protein Mapa_003658 [Marchantia paleacea]|nr:hypothetical protein Mapa_003658 [Marchantia paleacea]